MAPIRLAATDGVPIKLVTPTPAQRSWLERGLNQPGGKLPLFDRMGQDVNPRTIRSCIAQGWAEPWFRNPLKPDWLVCRLTAAGRAILVETPTPPVKAPKKPSSKAAKTS